jgi:two-component system chemotaxis response regulator CheB
MDAELLEAFLPEWAIACARLAAAPGDARALANLRALAEAPGAEALAQHIGVLPPDALAAQAETMLRPPMHAPQDGPKGAGVLIIDDSPTMRRILREIIAEDGAFAVLGEAGDGEAGLAAMARLQPSLTLLDIEMPHMDGIECLKRLRLMSKVPVIIVSSVAQAGSPQAIEARKFGAAEVIAKPSGAMSLDLNAKKGHEIVTASRRVLGLS